MKTSLESKLILAGIILLLLFGSAAPVRAASPSAPNASGGGSLFPLLGLISSWFRRNRTYRNANDFIDDQKAQYGDMLKQLDQQLANGTIYSPNGSDPEAHKAAYVEVRALLEQEQQQMTDFAEGIKKQARHDFNKSAREQIVNLVMSAGFAQNILGAVNNGIGQAQGLVNGAISSLSGEGSGDIANQIRGLTNFANELQAVGALIGGETGADLSSTVQDILAKINAPLDKVKENLDDIQSSLNDVQSQVQDLMAKGYQPTSSEVTQSAILQLVGLGKGDATTEALLTLLGIKTGTSAEDIRSRAEALLKTGEVVRCQKWGKDWKAVLQDMSDLLATQYANDAPGSDCTPIDPADLAAAINEQPSPTTGGNQGSSSGKVSAQDCDASSLISVSSSGVQWSNDGTMCYEDLVFNLNSETNESVVLYVHEKSTANSSICENNEWTELVVGGDEDKSAGGQENYSYPDESCENTEYIAIYNTNSCLAAGNDPAHAGVPIVPIPSHCP